MSAAVVDSRSLTGERAGASRPAIVIWALLSITALAIVGLILAAPVARAANHPGLATAIYRTFSFVCHQIPERSFHLAGYQFAVCSRCTGIYAGFAVAAVVYPLMRSLSRTDTPSRFWLILAAVPLAVDFSLGYFSIWPNTELSRFLTGALLSSVAAVFIVPGFIELSFSLRKFFRRTL